jgi:hypothetical protein
MVGLELDIDQLGLGASDLDHLIREGGQSRDVGIDYLDRARQSDPESLQAGDGPIPDHLLQLDIELVELHDRALSR